jgi:hypothetical protein
MTLNDPIMAGQQSFRSILSDRTDRILSKRFRKNIQFVHLHDIYRMMIISR